MQGPGCDKLNQKKLIRGPKWHQQLARWKTVEKASLRVRSCRLTYHHSQMWHTAETGSNKKPQHWRRLCRGRGGVCVCVCVCKLGTNRSNQVSGFSLDTPHFRSAFQQVADPKPQTATKRFQECKESPAEGSDLASFSQQQGLLLC